MIPLFKVFIAPESIENIKQVFESGMISQGPVVEQYETELKKYFGNTRLLALNSATSGLTLAFRLLNLPPNSIVLSTPLTCTATNWPILANGLKIKWVDVDPHTCNMDLKDLEKKLDVNTRAVIFVHWGGYPIDLDKLEDIKDNYRRKYNQELHIVEDCAHAFGAVYKYDKIGNVKKNICVFSTQAIKHLTTIDGGFITLPNDDMYKRAKKLRWFGIDRDMRTTPGGDFRLEPDVEEWGYKYNMNDVNAAVGLANLKYIDQNLTATRRVAEFYNQALGGVQGVELLQTVKGANPAYWIYTIKIVDKHGFVQYMKENGVMCSQVHNRNDVHSCVKEFKCDLPQLDVLENKIVSIPCGWWITSEQAEKIVWLIKEWCKKKVPVLCELTIYDDAIQFFNVFTQLNKQSFDNYTVQSFQQKIQQLYGMGQLIYIAKIDGVIVGTAKLVVEPKFFDSVGHIEDVVVDSRYRRLGIGKMLVDKLVELALGGGCYKVVLSANSQVEHFYIDCGFSRDVYNTSIVYRMMK
jgi:dTDP-4-amino-4,6-dideoxygalactose transaminase/GNAT superfamily N-acetyltransferase